MKITDEMREAVRTALAWPSPDAIIAAVAPLILEEAAKALDGLRERAAGEQNYCYEVYEAAEAIRALISEPQEDEELRRAEWEHDQMLRDP